MRKLKERLIEQVVAALQNATASQIYIILETIQYITQENPGA